VKAGQRLFLDASVLIAAAGSRTGASVLVFALCRQGHGRAVCSRRVLVETERNIRAKLGSAALLRFYEEIGNLGLDLVEDPGPGEIGDYAEITDPKDAHVLAGAAKGRGDVLLTLDRRHLLTGRVLSAGLPFAVMTPGEFLRRLV
jgi:predicted nucleic acid-binding protein